MVMVTTHDDMNALGRRQTLLPYVYVIAQCSAETHTRAQTEGKTSMPEKGAGLGFEEAGDRKRAFPWRFT